MSIVLGPNQYGKAQVRLVRVGRATETHTLTDLNVSVTLAGDLSDTHLVGDNANVLPTDTQKNTVYAFARMYGIEQIESFGILLARHFVDSQPSITRARVSIEEYGWQRLGPHSFSRGGGAVRSACVSYDGSTVWVVSGVADLVLLNTTGSQFHGFIKDRYTTLGETDDRILATAVNARWRHRDPTSTSPAEWAASYAESVEALTEAFVRTTPSLSLQQTLFAMGNAVLTARHDIDEVRLSLPNRHHFLVDMAAFGVDNPGEVFYAADRPYGLIEGTVRRDDAPPEGHAWSFDA